MYRCSFYSKQKFLSIIQYKESVSREFMLMIGSLDDIKIAILAEDFFKKIKLR